MKATILRSLANLYTRKNNHKNNAGFSLTEAVVTVGIGLTLASLSAPIFTNFKTEFVKQANALNTAQQADADGYKDAAIAVKAETLTAAPAK